MVDQAEALKLFEKSGAYLKGHFKLTSGRHSGEYIEKFQVLQYPEHTSLLCKEITDRFVNQRIDLVVGPATGGIILAHEVAKNLGTRAIFAERENGVMTFRRGFFIRPQEKVLIVEDVVTTGGSVKEVIDLVKKANGDIVGVGLLVDRSGGDVDLGVRTERLITLNIDTYDSSNCPLCKKGIPFTERGSRNI